jgi:hypothetical protein
MKEPPYYEGWQAAIDGVSYQDNPYAKGWREYGSTLADWWSQQWQAGWQAGYEWDRRREAHLKHTQDCKEALDDAFGR